MTLDRLPSPEVVPLLRPDELIGFGGMKRTTIYEGIRGGDIPSVRINGRIYVPTAELRRRWLIDVDAPEPTTPQLRAVSGGLS